MMFMNINLNHPCFSKAYIYPVDKIKDNLSRRQRRIKRNRERDSLLCTPQSIASIPPPLLIEDVTVDKEKIYVESVKLPEKSLFYKHETLYLKDDIEVQTKKTYFTTDDLYKKPTPNRVEIKFCSWSFVRVHPNEKW